MTQHFGFTKLVVADLEKAARFYSQVADLKELARVDAEIGGKPISEIMYHATQPGGATFVLLAFPQEPAPTPGGVIVGFQTDDVEAFVERAVAAGGALVEAPHDNPEHGVRVGFVSDPEGNLIEVVQLLPGGWQQ